MIWSPITRMPSRGLAVQKPLEVQFGELKRMEKSTMSGRRTLIPSASSRRTHPPSSLCAGVGCALRGLRWRLRRVPAPPPRAAPRCLGAPAQRERALCVTIAGAHQVPVLPRVGVEDRERAEAAPLLAGLDDGDGHAVEAAPLHARVEVARVADRPPHDVEEALGEAREGAEAAPVRELARDRRQQVDLGRAEIDRAVERDVPGEAPVDVPVAAELDGREEERDGVAGARDGAQLAPVGALALAVHLAPPAREVEQHELELERAPVELLEADVRL